MGHAIPWSPERDEQLDDLMMAGLSATQIAEEMGTTKNAVIGRLSRRDRRGSRAFERRVAMLAEIHASRPLPVQAPSWGRCQWPNGEVGAANFRFCGARALGGGPYCQEHARRAR